MGELILCNSPVAANSYYIEQASLNVYSIEELCFYIYNNVYLLDEGFINDSLLFWISDDLSDKKLALELKGLMEDDAPLNVIVGHILRSCGYLTRKEIKKTVEIISSFEGKTEAESRKLRADHMMADGRFADAVFAYEIILEKKLPMEESLKGNIYHNLGCALCGMFFFLRAKEYFEKAYRLNRNTESLEALLLSCLFGEDMDGFDLMCERYQVLPEQAESIKTRYEEALNCEKSKEFSEKLANRLKASKDAVEEEFIFSDTIKELKLGYRSLRTY